MEALQHGRSFYLRGLLLDQGTGRRQLRLHWPEVEPEAGGHVMVEHHHNRCAGACLQVWCPHHVAERLGWGCCQPGQETLPPGGASHGPWQRPARASSPSQQPFPALQSSVVLTGRGNQPCCPLHICRHLHSPGFQSPLDFGEKKLLGGFRLILQLISIKEGTKQLHSTFSSVKWSCRRWWRPSRVRCPQTWGNTHS